MSRYFITGTDTGVGKTHVTCALARLAADEGHRVFAFKPIETGCIHVIGDDQTELCRAAGGWQTEQLCGVYRFKAPMAPAVAARIEGVEIDLEKIREVVQDGARQSTVVLVEGAGGWRVPITESHDMSALARLLGLPTIVVSRAGLGTINHTLLTVEAIRHDQQNLAGVVISERPEDSAALCTSNIEVLQRRIGCPIIRFNSDPRVLQPLLSA